MAGCTCSNKNDISNCVDGQIGHIRKKQLKATAVLGLKYFEGQFCHVRKWQITYYHRGTKAQRLLIDQHESTGRPMTKNKTKLVFYIDQSQGAMFWNRVLGFFLKPSSSSLIGWLTCQTITARFCFVLRLDISLVLGSIVLLAICWHPNRHEQ